MADTAPAPLSPGTQVILELAAAAGMTPQEFLFGGIGLVTGPFQKELADRIFNAVMAKFGNSAEIAQKIKELQDGF